MTTISTVEKSSETIEIAAPSAQLIAFDVYFCTSRVPMLLRKSCSDLRTFTCFRWCRSSQS